MSWALVKYVFAAAIRDRLVLSLFFLLVMGASLSVFFGGSAVNEQDQFTLVFAAGSLRIVGVAGLVLFVVFMIRRSFDAKDVEFLLSRPIGRIQFLLSYALAFSLLAALMAAAQTGSLYILGPHLFGRGHILWGLSILIENIIMVNMALFFAMFINSAASAAMGVFAFYVFARMTGQILGIVDSHIAGSQSGGLEVAAQMFSAITPRLDLMGQSAWLVYGPGDAGLPFLLAQGAVFTALVLLAALIDLVKRQF